MNWLADITPPGIKKIFRARDGGGDDTLWCKCASCAEMIFLRDLEATHQVCPSCDHHFKIEPHRRLAMTFDDGVWVKIDLPETVSDPLKFKDERKYTDRLRDSRKKTGETDALVIGSGKIGGVEAVAAVQNFAFMGGSMGMSLGEGLIAAAEAAVARRAALIVFSASGGARMQEGILSLMQMPRTTIAIQLLREAVLPYIVVLTNPTTGGVTASYAMLGDVHLAEPGALIGFAGPRVIEQTIREKLPEGFQRAEYLYDRGMVDCVVHRKDLTEKISQLIRVLMKYGVKRAEPEDADLLALPSAIDADPDTEEVNVHPPLDEAAE